MKIGSVESTPLTTTSHRLTMLLWGKPACGKTVLASTMPGRKLWLLFDPEGVASIKRRDDIEVVDFSAYPATRMGDFKQGNIIEKDLNKALNENKFDSVVLDSLTSFGQLALYYAIYTGVGKRGDFVPSIENPGMTGYGARTGMILDAAQMVMRMCVDKGLHLCMICHEQEKVDESTNKVAEITLSVGGSAANVMPARISEIWRVEDTGRERNIYFRNHGLWRPMRSRMFTPGDGGKQTAFKWDYNQDTGVGNGLIDTWYNKWRDAGFNKIPAPLR